MNIFYLSKNPKECAEMHLDRHVVKMIIEYAQLMSTAHRVIDGQEYYDLTANNRKIKRWRLDDDRESVLMKASHINHPSAVWTRTSDLNYIWLYNMWSHLLNEYTYRYGKTHACARLYTVLSRIPEKIEIGFFTDPTPAMPDECKIAGDSLASYHKYYIEKKNHFARWTKRQPPIWYIDVIDNNAHI